MNIGRLTNRVVLRDGATSPVAARRLVESTSRTELSSFELDEPGFVAVRRLRVRLVSRTGLPSRHALAKAWKTALRKALKAELGRAEGGWGVGENVVRWPDERQARVAWLARWTTREERPWWSRAVGSTMGVTEPLEPAHMLMFWADREPESLPGRIVDLGADHPAFSSVSRADLEQVWRVYSQSVEARHAALGRQPQNAGGVEASFEPGQIDMLPNRLRETVAAWARQPQHIRHFGARMAWRLELPHLNPVETSQVVQSVLEDAPEPAIILETGDARPLSDEAAKPVVFEDSSTSSPTNSAAKKAEAKSATDTDLTGSRGDETREPESYVWELAGHALLIHPLLAEAHRRRLGGDSFSTVWNELTHAVFWRTHGPSRGHLRRALEAGGEVWSAWFGAQPGLDWLEEPNELANEWLDQLCCALPEEWGTTDERWQRLTVRPSMVATQLPFVDLAFPIEAVDIEVRKRGWDIDPGWLPELGRVLRFHYDEG